jgi:uncharacterized protein (DUF2336 family)
LSIDPEVTDVLVTRGNREVVRSVATNAGARLSNLAILQMIKRSESDAILIEEMGCRKGIPRHLFQQLIAKASENTKKRLGSERPEAADQIDTLLTDVTRSLHSKFGPASKSYFNAKRVVAGQHAIGNLNEKLIFEYAQFHKFELTTVGLALLCSLPVDVVERALNNKNRELALILCKALGFSWQTAMSLLFLGASDHRIHAQDLEKWNGSLIGSTGRLAEALCRPISHASRPWPLYPRTVVFPSFITFKISTNHGIGSHQLCLRLNAC